MVSHLALFVISAASQVAWMQEVSQPTFEQIQEARTAIGKLGGSIDEYVDEETNIRRVLIEMPLKTDNKLLESLPTIPFTFGLRLFHTDVTDAGMKLLSRQKHIAMLDLTSTRITDSGLKELTCLDGLSRLSLRSTIVTDAGLKELVDAKELSRLHLSNTKITDAGMQDLLRMKKLSSLSLNNTAVTDIGARQLAGIKNLKLLDLRNTRVTDAGIRAIQMALPRCKIER